ncbi:MAG: MaoC family dehydratase [Firmicutes bacterium]|nr:MaoC family dehydratase [Bacillota bacterium]
MSGRTIQELTLGDKAQVSKTVTEADIAFYSAISGNFSPAYVDQAYAKGTSYGARIAPWGVPGGLMAPILGMHLPGLGSLALESWTRHHQPVYIGDTVTCTGELVEKDEARNVVEIGFTMTNQNGVVVMTGGARMMPPKRRG